MKWLTINEVAARHRISDRTVRRYLAAGILKGRRLGPKLIRISEADADALLGPASI